MFKYEGCGEIGSLRAIFLAQFHHLQGPMIRCQWPEDYISKETFDVLSRFIIPKNEVQEQTITINSMGFKISGYPTYLKDKKYPRNYLLFNLCIVCHPWSRTVQFEPFVRKLSKFFVNLEKESEILSTEVEEGSSTSLIIQSILAKVYDDINTQGKTVVIHEKNSLHLSVIALGSQPSQVEECEAPMLVKHIGQFQRDQFDLTTTKILPHINGFNPVSKIGALADVEVNSVRACIQNLLYHKVVAVVPVFQYSNIYTVTPHFSVLCDDQFFREELRSFTISEKSPSLMDLYKFISSFTYGITLKDICIRMNPQRLGFDERRLVQFLVLKGALRRVHKYPVYQGEDEKTDPLYNWFTSQFNTDQICIKTGLSTQELDFRIDSDPNILVLWK